MRFAVGWVGGFVAELAWVSVDGGDVGRGSFGSFDVIFFDFAGGDWSLLFLFAEFDFGVGCDVYFAVAVGFEFGAFLYGDGAFFGFEDWFASVFFWLGGCVLGFDDGVVGAYRCFLHLSALWTRQWWKFGWPGG